MGRKKCTIPGCPGGGHLTGAHELELLLMGKTDEQKLADTVATARELVSTLRGIQKDLRADARAIKETMSETVESRIEKAVNEGLNTMYAELEKLRIRNFREIEASINSGFKVLRDVAFGKNRTADDYVRIMMMVKAAAEQFDLQAPLSEAQDLASVLINRMIQGAPRAEVVPGHLCADCANSDSVGPCCADPVDREE